MSCQRGHVQLSVAIERVLQKSLVDVRVLHLHVHTHTHTHTHTHNHLNRLSYWVAVGCWSLLNRMEVNEIKFNGMEVK